MVIGRARARPPRDGRPATRAVAPSARARSPPRPPGAAARAAMPCWNSGGKLASESSGTPSALSPWKLSATASDTGVVGIEGGGRVEIRDQPPQQLAPRVPVVNAAGSGTRRRRGSAGASRRRPGCRPAPASRSLERSWLLRRHVLCLADCKRPVLDLARGSMSWRRQVGEDVRGRRSSAGRRRRGCAVLCRR